MRCPKCKCEEYQKSGIVKGKRRYKCKKCRYNYSAEKYYKYYSDEEKKEELRYYNEGDRVQKNRKIAGDVA